MKTIRRIARFTWDVNWLQQQGKDLEKLESVLASLVKEEGLPPRYRDHVLVGQYKGTRECHIGPDWLLIYELSETEILLIRTGSHQGLFR